MENQVKLAKSYLIHFKNGNVVELAGNTITEAFAQTQQKTQDGNIDFSIMDFFLPIFTIMNQSVDEEYKIFLMKDKDSQWEESKVHGECDFNLAEEVMNFKIKVEGFFSGIVVRMSDEKILSWKWA